MNPNRKNIRADFHDYSGGDYFVTICTRNKEHYFGKIIRPPNIIQTVENQHNRRDARPVRPESESCDRPVRPESESGDRPVRPKSESGDRLVRPESESGDHAEMMFSPIGKYCQEQLESITTHYPYAAVSLYVIMPNHIHAIISVCGNRTHEPSVPNQRTALSVVVGGLKRAVTMFARRNGIEFGWQGRYHDHIIRGMRDGNMIEEYIKNNVDRWASDCFYN